MHTGSAGERDEVLVCVAFFIYRVLTLIPGGVLVGWSTLTWPPTGGVGGGRESSRKGLGRRSRE